MAGLLDILTANSPFMDNAGNVYPQSGGILDPIASTPALASATKFDWGSGNSIWPMLTALGAGLAGGTGYNSKQRLASGLSQGLGAATQVGQQARQEALRLQEIQNEAADRKAQLALGLANFNLNAGLRKDAQELQKQADTREQTKLSGPLNLIATSANNYASAKKILTAPTSAWNQFWDSGDVGRANQTIRTGLAGASAIVPGTTAKDLYDAMAIGRYDSQETRIAKLNAFEQFMNGAVGQVSAGYPALAPTTSKINFGGEAWSPPAPAPAASGTPNTQANTQATAAPYPNRTSGGMIPPDAVRYLRAHPETKAAFEAKFGVSASAFLGQ